VTIFFLIWEEIPMRNLLLNCQLILTKNKNVLILKWNKNLYFENYVSSYLLTSIFGDNVKYLVIFFFEELKKNKIDFIENRFFIDIPDFNFNLILPADCFEQQVLRDLIFTPKSKYRLIDIRNIY